MTTSKRNYLLAGAILLAFAGGSAHAGGPVGNIPFDGDGSGNGFTIDNGGFVATDVSAAPCPAGATCTASTATSDEMLMREVDIDGTRYFQMIFTDTGGSQGDFISESVIAMGGDANTFAGKIIIDDADREFLSGQAFYRGAVFGGSAGNNAITVSVDQSISGDFQTFSLETEAAPNQGANGVLRNGRLQILQDGTGNMAKFGHTIVAGTHQTVAGSLTAGNETITFDAGQAVSATWIGVTMSGGGPGPTGNHDARPADHRDFGLLVYRTNNGATMGNQGSAGGTPNGIVDPQFTQSEPAQTARAFSGPDPLLQDSGMMYNLDHGSFIGGADILAIDWASDVFGDNPY